MIKSFINYIRQSDLIYTILIVLFVILVSTVIIKLFTSAIDYDNSPVAKKRQMIDNFFNQCIADAPTTIN